MSKKKVSQEEHINETWLIPYSDMLTLLLALFIVMFAMSQIDKKKFEQFSTQFNIIFSGGSKFSENNGNVIVPSANLDSEKLSAVAVDEDTLMKKIKELLEKEIGKQNYSDKIKLELNREGLEIAIQDTVLFASGEATILHNVTPILHLIAKVLSEIDNDIKIVGHTDNIPIKNNKFRSNWDLSAIRAVNVMEFLVDKGNLRPKRFVVQGNGEYSPKFDNSTKIGRAQNRRVDIIVIRKYPLTQNNSVAVKNSNESQ